MAKQTPPKRKYDSSRRKEQALHTQRQIVEAARSLFISRGYAGATIEAIAQEAGVAVETVYASFGSKRAILSKLIDVSIVGDDQPIPLLQRQGPQMVQLETNQHRQIKLFVNDIYEIMGRVAPIFDIMRVAAKTEPDISEMFQIILNARVQGMMTFVNALMKNGPLREGLIPEEAAETVWALTSGEVYILFITNRGWTENKYKQWMVNALEKLLLP
ncbi:MAG: helix-turn-helix domain-containing protein [Anaerolineales bacterium]|nr:helix-turn-helix domain-containing protein [Anaerolineales bacterium]